jgi:hypothetical protein
MLPLSGFIIADSIFKRLVLPEFLVPETISVFPPLSMNETSFKAGTF